MDEQIFEHSYYRLNKRLLSLIGQWPYQDMIERRFRMCIVISLLISFTASQVIYIYTS